MTEIDFIRIIITFFRGMCQWFWQDFSGQTHCKKITEKMGFRSRTYRSKPCDFARRGSRRFLWRAIVRNDCAERFSTLLFVQKGFYPPLRAVIVIKVKKTTAILYENNNPGTCVEVVVLCGTFNSAGLQTALRVRGEHTDCFFRLSKKLPYELC